MARPPIIEPEARPLEDLELVARIFRILGDRSRLAVVERLADGPAIQKELVEMLGLAQSQVSDHLACLVWCGIVRAERDGRTVRYELADPRALELVGTARRMLDANEAQIASCRVVEG